MKEPNPLPIAEFKGQIKGLIDQLFIANLHFQIGTGLRKSWSEYHPEIVQAPVFWEYTIHAHDTMAVLALCRLYDNTKCADKRSLTLRRFLATVERRLAFFQKRELQKRLAKNVHLNYLSQLLKLPDANQLKTEKDHCAPIKIDNDLCKQIKMDKDLCEDKLVHDLIKLRHRVIAHLDYDYAVGKEKDYFKSHPFPYPAIQDLIERGFEIVNHYSETTHSARLASNQDQDYLEVFKSLGKLRIRNWGHI
jgi:hypothetical protein